MAEIQNLKSLKAKLTARAREAGKKVSVTVGFTQSYAVYVHENLTAHHPVGEAKFLEGPYREMSNSGELSRLVNEGYRQTGDFGQSLLLAGLRLQREAQMRCPVDTGALRASAFTRLEN